jgi:hypothetical protein
MATNWLSLLPRPFHKLALQDMEESIRFQLRPSEQAKVQWLITSEEILDWLQATESQVVVAQGERAPDALANALAFTSAFIAQSLRESYPYPVLYYSCGLRNEASPSNDESGPVALLNSLNSQLLCWLTQGDQQASLTLLNSDRYCQWSQENASNALDLFKHLVHLIPTRATLFIVVDGLSRLSGTESQGEETLRGILRPRSYKNPSVKVLLTDLLSTECLRKRRYVEVCVPEHANGEGQQLNVQHLDEHMRESIGSLY